MHAEVITTHPETDHRQAVHTCLARYSENKYTIHNFYNPPSYKTERRTWYVTVVQSAQETSTDPQHCGYPPTTMSRHTMEGMLTASDIILPYDEADDIGNDHRPALFQLTNRTMQPQHTWIWRWNYKEAHWIKFREISDKHLHRLQLQKDANKNYRKVCDVIKDAARQSITRINIHKYTHRGLMDIPYSGINNIMQPD